MRAPGSIRCAAIEPLPFARPLSLHSREGVGRTRQGAERLRQLVMLLASPALDLPPTRRGPVIDITDESRSDRDHR